MWTNLNDGSKRWICLPGLKSTLEKILEKLIMRISMGKQLALILITGFGVILILSAVTISYMLTQTNSVKNHTNEVLNNEIPYMVHLMDLDRQVYQTVHYLNQYLISGDEKDLSRFEQSMNSLKQKINQQYDLSDADFKTTSLMKVIFLKYREKTEEVIRVKGDYTENFYGIVQAQQLLNPLYHQFIGALGGLIDSQVEASLEVDNREILTTLLRVKSSWTSMIMSLRIYFKTRSDFDQKRIFFYLDQNKEDMGRLLKQSPQLDFDAVFVDELANIHKLYLKNLPEVLDVFKKEKWRMDLYLMRTQINPITDSLRKLVRSLVLQKQAKTSQQSDILSDKLDGLGEVSIKIMIVSILISLLVIVLVARNIKAVLKRFDSQSKP